MKYIKISILILASFAITLNLQAQTKFGAKIKINHREDSGAGYDFFLGKDAEDFQTTINGFGSGFLFDVLTGRNSIDFLQLGTKNAYLSLGAGLSINKYRFKNNLVFSLSDDGNMVNYMIDDNPDHNYVNTFFGYGKSKLVTSTFFVPVNINVVIADMFVLSAGGFVDFYFYGKHKIKYLDGEEKKKELISPKDFTDYNLNKIKYGLSASIIHKNTGIGLIGTYYLTPFFQENMGPEINEARICLIFSMNPKLINR